LRKRRPGTPAFFETKGYIAIHSWRERIMPTGDLRAGFAINVGYFFLAAAVLVFIAMLALTLHP
jgi:hypothetical protein